MPKSSSASHEDNRSNKRKKHAASDAASSRSGSGSQSGNQGKVTAAASTDSQSWQQDLGSAVSYQDSAYGSSLSGFEAMIDDGQSFGGMPDSGFDDLSITETAAVEDFAYGADGPAAAETVNALAQILREQQAREAAAAAQAGQGIAAMPTYGSQAPSENAGSAGAAQSASPSASEGSASRSGKKSHDKSSDRDSGRSSDRSGQRASDRNDRAGERTTEHKNDRAGDRVGERNDGRDAHSSQNTADNKGSKRAQNKESYSDKAASQNGSSSAVKGSSVLSSGTAVAYGSAAHEINPLAGISSDDGSSLQTLNAAHYSGDAPSLSAGGYDYSSVTQHIPGGSVSAVADKSISPVRGSSIDDNAAYAPSDASESFGYPDSDMNSDRTSLVSGAASGKVSTDDFTSQVHGTEVAHQELNIPESYQAELSPASWIPTANEPRSLKHNTGLTQRSYENFRAPVMRVPAYGFSGLEYTEMARSFRRVANSAHDLAYDRHQTGEQGNRMYIPVPRLFTLPRAANVQPASNAQSRRRSTTSSRFGIAPGPVLSRRNPGKYEVFNSLYARGENARVRNHFTQANNSPVRSAFGKGPSYAQCLPAPHIGTPPAMTKLQITPDTSYQSNSVDKGLHGARITRHQLSGSTTMGIAAHIARSMAAAGFGADGSTLRSSGLMAQVVRSGEEVKSNQTTLEVSPSTRITFRVPQEQLPAPEPVEPQALPSTLEGSIPEEQAPGLICSNRMAEDDEQAAVMEQERKANVAMRAELRDKGQALKQEILSQGNTLIMGSISMAPEAQDAQGPVIRVVRNERNTFVPSAEARSLMSRRLTPEMRSLMRQQQVTLPPDYFFESLNIEDREKDDKLINATLLGNASTRIVTTSSRLQRAWSGNSTMAAPQAQEVPALPAAPSTMAASELTGSALTGASASVLEVEAVPVEAVPAEPEAANASAAAPAAAASSKSAAKARSAVDAEPAAEQPAKAAPARRARRTTKRK